MQIRLVSLLSLAVIALLTMSGAVHAQGFNSLTSPDGINIVAVGNTGKFYRSANSGITYFNDTIPGNPNLYSVTSYGNNVWISSDNGNVIKTGKTLSAKSTYYVGNSIPLRSVFFIDDNIGFVCGPASNVYKSVNGGVNWTLSNTGLSAGNGNLNSISFKDANNGTVVANNGTIFITSDGGNSWSLEVSGTNYNLLKVKYFGDDRVVTGEYGTLLTNTGSGWTGVNTRVKTDITGVSGSGINDVHVCGASGFIRNNKSGSSAFLNFEENPMMALMSDIFYSDNNKGWAVCSSNMVIIYTTNGGTNWSMPLNSSVAYSWAQKQATSGNIGNPFCLHPQNRNGVFILAGSSLYRSLDKGNTWTLIASGIPGGSCHSFFVNAIDTNLMIASKGADASGRLIKSTNYGATWTDIFNPITLTSYGAPLEVDPNSPNTVYLAPDADTLMKSTDWGTTWTSLGGGESGNIFRSPCDVVIQFDNPNTILVADGVTSGGTGKFWKSVNGGYNWTLINTVSGTEIPMVANTVLNLNLVYHSTWSSGSYWKSVNTGSNFTSLSQSGSLWATDIAKDDPTTVCYDYYSSTNVMLSLNTGASFTSSNLGNSPAAGMCFMDRNNLLVQHSSGVYKMTATYTHTPSVPNIDVQPTSLNGTGSQYYSSTTIFPTGTVKNNDAVLPATFTITRKITPGGYSSTKTVTNLLPSTSATVNYDPWTFTAGTNYSVKDSVHINGDNNTGNDLLSGSITPYIGQAIQNVSEDFAGSFPPANWSIVYTGTNYWSKSSVGGYANGSGSAKFDYWNSSTGTIQSMLTNTFTGTQSGDSLKFDYSYAPYNNSSFIDSLYIETSTDGGTTYTILSRYRGRNSDTIGVGISLKTTASSGSEFTPSTSGQWLSKRIALPVGTTKVRFRARSGNGNNLYIDNINISSFTLFTQYNIKIAPEGFYNGSTLNMSDTVKAYLRNTVSPFNFVDSATAVFNDVTFNAPFVFKNAPTGTYYLQIIHRNALETWSKTGGEPFAKGVTANYDFTSAQSQAYGSNMVQVSGLWCLYSGDIVKDGQIELSDLLDAFNDASNFETGYLPTDVTGDGLVELSDIVTVFNNATSFVTKNTPETSPADINSKKEFLRKQSVDLAKKKNSENINSNINR